MKKILLALLFLSLKADSFESWIGSQVSGNISDRYKMSLYQEFDSIDFLGDYYFYLTDLTLTSKIGKHFSWEPSLRTAFTKNIYELWSPELTPSLSVLFNADLKFLDLYSRAGFMYRFFLIEKNRDVFRLKAGLGAPLSKLRFYVENEVMRGYNGLSQIDDNRASIGVNLHFGDHINVSLYYLRNDFKLSKYSSWQASNVFGFIFGTSF